jgi:hypothetical protein
MTDAHAIGPRPSRGLEGYSNSELVLIRRYVFLRRAARKHILDYYQRLPTNRHILYNRPPLVKRELSNSKPTPSPSSKSGPFSRLSPRLDNRATHGCTGTAVRHVPRLLHHRRKILGTVEKLLCCVSRKFPIFHFKNRAVLRISTVVFQVRVIFMIASSSLLATRLIVVISVRERFGCDWPIE